MDAVERIIQWIIVGLGAITMYFFNKNNENIEHRLFLLESELTETRLNYVLKSDFKEFKEELWHRLDELKEQRKL